MGNKWFTRDCVPGAVHTRRGSLAGMSLADVVYALVFACVLKHARNSVREKHLETHCVTPSGQFGLVEYTYADDVVIP